MPGGCEKMDCPALRRFLFTVAGIVLSFTLISAVSAARDSDSATSTATPAVSSANPSTDSTSPPLPLADYATHLPVTGPTTPFHDSVSTRYNYVFGRDTPFLPSNASSANGQFLNPKSFYTAEYCGHCHQEAY